MALFHTILLEFVFIDQISLVFSKKLSKKLADILTFLDLIMIVVLVVEVDVLDAVRKLIYYITYYG